MIPRRKASRLGEEGSRSQSGWVRSLAGDGGRTSDCNCGKLLGPSSIKTLRFSK